MKKLLCVLITITVLFALSSTSLAASEPTLRQEALTVEYLEDGSRIETTIIIEENSFSTFASKETNGTKRITYVDNGNEIQWTATLSGTFTYTGSSSTCTASSITYSIVNDNWKITSATASKSGNTATGNVTAKHYTLGILTKTVKRTITLTCSASGVLS